MERACRGLLDAIADARGTSMTPFEKSRPGAPPGFFAVEAAGLAWLGAVDALRVGRVVEVAADRLVLDRVVEVPPTASAAEQLGRGLALVHRAGAAAPRCTAGRLDRRRLHRHPAAAAPRPRRPRMGRVLRRARGWRRTSGWLRTAAPWTTPGCGRSSG